MNHDDVRNILSRHDLRCTKQRADVYAALAACRSHPTAEELHRMVSDTSAAESISLATIYNSLEALTSAGLCRKIPTSSGCRYDADVRCHMHVAMPDGRLVDVPEELSRQLLSAIPREALDELGRVMGLRISHLGVQAFADPTAPAAAPQPTCEPSA